MYCLTSVIASSIFLYLESMTSFTNLMLSAQCVILNLGSPRTEQYEFFEGGRGETLNALPAPQLELQLL